MKNGEIDVLLLSWSGIDRIDRSIQVRRWQQFTSILGTAISPNALVDPAVR